MRINAIRSDLVCIYRQTLEAYLRKVLHRNEQLSAMLRLVQVRHIYRASSLCRALCYVLS